MDDFKNSDLEFWTDLQRNQLFFNVNNGPRDMMACVEERECEIAARMVPTWMDGGEDVINMRTKYNFDSSEKTDGEDRDAK